MGASTRTSAARVFLALCALAAVFLVALVFFGGSEVRPGGLVPREVYATGVDWDVACSTTKPNGDPGGCSTPLPSLEAAAVAAARPLEIAAVDIPIGSTGPFEAYLGDVTLANGVLHEVEFHVDGIPLGTQVLPAGLEVSGMIRVLVRSEEPGAPPFGNGYARGWHTGVEVAKVYLVMDVTRFDPGMVFKLRDVVVK